MSSGQGCPGLAALKVCHPSAPRVWSHWLPLTRDVLNASVTLLTTSGHLLWPVLCWALEIRADSPSSSISEELCPESDGCVQKQPMGYRGLWGLWGLWGLEKGEPLLPGLEGEDWAPMSWACQSRRSFRRQPPARSAGGREAGPAAQAAGPWASSQI